MKFFFSDRLAGLVALLASFCWFSKVIGVWPSGPPRLAVAHRREAGKAMGFMSKNRVYVLFSLKDQKTYTGSTDNLERRLYEHETGQCSATKNRRPLQLMYYEEVDSLDEARRREKYFKTASGRKVLRKILENL